MFKELTEAEWKAFEEKHPQGTMSQSYEQYLLLKKRKPNVKMVGLVEKQEIVAGAIITWNKVKFGNMFNIASGPILDYENKALIRKFFDGLTWYAKKRNGLFVRISPNIVYQKYDNQGEKIGKANNKVYQNLIDLGFDHRGFKQGMSTDGEPSYQYRKDLSGLTNETLVQSFNKDGKYYLQKTKQFGIQVREITNKDELKTFKAVTEQTAKRRNFQDKDLAYYETVFDIFDKKAHFTLAEIDFVAYQNEELAKIAELEKTIVDLTKRQEEKPSKRIQRQLNEYLDQKKQHEKRVLRAKEFLDQGKQKELAAVALFIEQAQEMDYMFSGSVEEYKEFYAPYAIQAEMLKLAVTHNIPMYNFLGIDGTFDKNDGVFKFKAGFNGVAEQMLGEFDFAIDKPKYFLYKTLKKIIGRD